MGGNGLALNLRCAMLSMDRISVCCLVVAGISFMVLCAALNTLPGVP
jgi:hypothetical protein